MNATTCEATHKRMEQRLKHLWESINVIFQACEQCHAQLRDRCPSKSPFRIARINDGAKGPMGRTACLTWLDQTPKSSLHEWGLIVAISVFDAWLEDTVSDFHRSDVGTKTEARNRGYNCDRPSFSTGFFVRDQGGIGLSFAPTDPLIAEFVKIKETRNLLVHKDGRVSKRFHKDIDQSVAVGRKVAIDLEYLRTSMATTLELGREIRRQLRKVIKAKARAALRATKPHQRTT